MGTPYTWGMGKREAGSLARKTFLTFSLKNRHGMAFPFPTNYVLKMSVSGKYNFFYSFPRPCIAFWCFSGAGQKYVFMEMNKIIIFPEDWHFQDIIYWKGGGHTLSIFMLRRSNEAYRTGNVGPSSKKIRHDIGDIVRRRQMSHNVGRLLLIAQMEPWRNSTTFFGAVAFCTAKIEDLRKMT